MIYANFPKQKSAVNLPPVESGHAAGTLRSVGTDPRSPAFASSTPRMSIRVALNHVTHYKYDRPVTLSPQVIRLRPAPHCRTPITAYSLRVTPGDHFLNWQQDPFGNYQA